MMVRIVSQNPTTKGVQIVRHELANGSVTNQANGPALQLGDILRIGESAVPFAILKPGV